MNDNAILEVFHQLGPGQPWDLLASDTLYQVPDPYQEPVAGLDLDPLLYRYKLWNADHTRLIHDAICNSNTSRT